ncbi:MAG: HAD family hydrolase [Candidatus Heimdallarchaeota archaeon]|nr:HAD family hydrolase [Candidatus Heimdallarchaeota archaeon]MCK4253842.1 HAD family hydrolase [Candidatus Heimdallarchaeota archaeon]
MNLMRSIQLVVFDLDGTLIQSNIDYMGIRDEVREMLKDLVPPDEFQIIKNTPTTILNLVELVKDKDTLGGLYEKAWLVVEEAERVGYEEAKIEEDVHSTLSKLQLENFDLAIFTNNSRKLTDYGMKKFELDQYTDVVITRDDVEEAKPNPEGLIKIMNHFNRSIEQTIFIGDSWLDAETAEVVGVDFIYFGDSSAPGTRRKKIEVTKVVKKISEILNYF